MYETVPGELSPGADSHFESRFVRPRLVIGKSDEVFELGARLSDAHGKAVTEASCLVSLVSSLFETFKLTNTPVGAKLLALQTRCVKSWLREQGADPAQLDLAVSGLERAAETAKYIDELPD